MLAHREAGQGTVFLGGCHLYCKDRRSGEQVPEVAGGKLKKSK